VTGAFERSLRLGDPYHIGIAVNDIERAIADLDATLGAGPWGRMDADVPAIYRGTETVTGIRSAFARTGSLLIELVQPTAGDFTAKTFLAERGEGVYHAGYWVEDMETTLERAEEIGLGVDWCTPKDGVPFAVYLDSARTLGLHIELVSLNMKPVIDQALKKAGA
jgi:methylmalonyl-CoA/ethylmalonyl-CoA epimerase